LFIDLSLMRSGLNSEKAFSTVFFLLLKGKTEKEEERSTLFHFLLGGRFSSRRGEKVTLTGLWLGLSLPP